MIRLLFVGDGERDSATVPHFVETILDTKIAPTTRIWARLHGPAGPGYTRKLLYALRVARDLDVPGLVATVDSDRERKGERLKTLQDGRAADRERHPPMPAALGEALPHAEAWLLDDAIAVRTGMALPEDVKVPSVGRTRHPKNALHDLLAKSSRAEDRPIDVWADITTHLDPARCQYAKKTGFHAFVDDVRSELESLSQAG